MSFDGPPLVLTYEDQGNLKPGAVAVLSAYGEPMPSHRSRPWQYSGSPWIPLRRRALEAVPCFR